MTQTTTTPAADILALAEAMTECPCIRGPESAVCKVCNDEWYAAEAAGEEAHGHPDGCWCDDDTEVPMFPALRVACEGPIMIGSDQDAYDAGAISLTEIHESCCQGRTFKAIDWEDERTIRLALGPNFRVQLCDGQSIDAEWEVTRYDADGNSIHAYYASELVTAGRLALEAEGAQGG